MDSPGRPLPIVKRTSPSPLAFWIYNDVLYSAVLSRNRCA